MKIKRFVFNPVYVNCYLLWDDTKEAVLIDCGAWCTQEQEELKEFVATNGLTIRHHLNTHLHFDHIFGNPFVEEAFGIKATASDKDWRWAVTIKERLKRFGISYDKEIPPLGRVLADGDEVLFGNQRIVAIAVPGHSQGSLAYYIPSQGALFSGDALFCGSIGRTDFEDSSHRQLLTSIKERLFTLPDETTVYPGHDKETTIGTEKKYNAFLK